MTSAALPGLIYEAAVDAARWPAVLDAMREEFGAVAGVLVLTDAVRSEIDLAVASGVMASPALQEEYQRDWADRDPGLAIFSRMAAGRIAITSQIWGTLEERQAMPFHRDFYYPNGFSDSLCVSLAQGEGRKGLLALMRGRGSPDFAADDARRLKGLTLHLQRSLQLHEEIVERTRREGSFSAAAERLAAGLVVLDAGGAVVAANAAARRIAARDDGVSLTVDRLGFPHDPEAAAFCRTCVQGGGDEVECRRLLRRAGEALPYGLTVAPLPPPPGALRSAGGALVTITEPRAPSPRTVAVVARHFGLTPGEAGLLQSILEGRSLGDHASARGLTPHAARFHAKRVFAKADVRNLPPVRGHIRMEAVSFRYRIDGSRVLSDVTLDIPAGQVIGVVGSSGSGKSTFAKLVQRLFIPETGRVLVDGSDLALVDPAWLRRQIGVVLQENVLFNRTVRDNIALADPGMSMERVVAAAELAGAHDFILALPEGYSTMIGERGASLSGGQRQRVAIARALVGEPRILIFDEATSALDYESEAAIQANMRRITRGRTVILVAHRLSTLRGADRIVTLEGGRIVEDGDHAALLKAGGRYAQLWALQSGKAASEPSPLHAEPVR